jgi:PAS domain S-box-containing protein
LVWQLANQRIQAIELANKMTHDLQESEFRWKIAIEGAGDGQWDWDLKNNKLFFSSRFKALLGQSDDWDYDMASWERCIHPDDKPDAIAQMQACLFSMASIYRTEYRVICKDGSWKWLL